VGEDLNAAMESAVIG